MSCKLFFILTAVILISSPSITVRADESPIESVFADTSQTASPDSSLEILPDSLRTVEPKKEESEKPKREFKRTFNRTVENLFSFSPKIYPDSLFIPYREFNNITVGESFLPVIVGPPGQARSFILNGNPSTNPYLIYNGGLMPESYWSLPCFRGPDLNSFPTEGIESLTLLNGAASITGGFGCGADVLDVKLRSNGLGVDSLEAPLTDIRVLRAPNDYHKTGITISKKGPYNSKLLGIMGIVSSTGYLPRSQYDALYFGLNIGFDLCRLPIELSGYRYRGRGEYTILNYYNNQDAEFSRDIISLSAKTQFMVSDSSAISINSFLNRRPYTAADPSNSIYYRTINTTGGLTSEYEAHFNRHNFYAGSKLWYESAQSVYIGNPDMWRGNIIFGDIYQFRGIKFLFLGRYDRADIYNGGLSGALGVNIDLSNGFRFYSTLFYQTIFPDLLTTHWAPSNYKEQFNIGDYIFRERGAKGETGSKRGIDLGINLRNNLFSLKSGVVFSLSDDMIIDRYNVDQNAAEHYFSPSDFKSISIYMHLKTPDIWDILKFSGGVRYTKITYDDGYPYNLIPKTRVYLGSKFRKELFIKDLIFEGGAEIDYTSARFIPGIVPQYEDYYWIINAGFSITYKDFTFYFNGDNIQDQVYYSNGLNPILGGYDWWEIRWIFRD